MDDIWVGGRMRPDIPDVVGRWGRRARSLIHRRGVFCRQAEYTHAGGKLPGWFPLPHMRRGICVATVVLRGGWYARCRAGGAFEACFNRTIRPAAGVPTTMNHNDCDVASPRSGHCGRHMILPDTGTITIACSRFGLGESFSVAQRHKHAQARCYVPRWPGMQNAEGRRRCSPSSWRRRSDWPELEG